MSQGYDASKGSVFPVDDAEGNLPRTHRKAIRSLQKQVEQHQRKIADFKRDQSVRPGMETLDAEAIATQQQRRIQHLEREVRTFQNTIRRLMVSK